LFYNISLLILLDNKWKGICKQAFFRTYNFSGFATLLWETNGCLTPRRLTCWNDNFVSVTARLKIRLITSVVGYRFLSLIPCFPCLEVIYLYQRLSSFQGGQNTVSAIRWPFVRQTVHSQFLVLQIIPICS
jgi:hypothetical protein